MVEIPDTLVERLKARQAVLVTGMGCSELAGAPGWKAFAESLAARLVFSDAQATATRLIGAGRLGDALAVIRDLLPPPALEEAIRQSYPGEAPVPEGLKVAGQFPWRAIVTTAYDDLWERALDSGDRPEPLRIMVGTEATAAARFGGTGAPLLHLFGRVASPKSLCLGPADARTRLVPSAGLGWLGHLRRRRTLVFVGFRPGESRRTPACGGGAGGRATPTRRTGPAACARRRDRGTGSWARRRGRTGAGAARPSHRTAPRRSP